MASDTATLTRELRAVKRGRRIGDIGLNGAIRKL